MEYIVKTGQDINSYTEKLKPGDVVLVESGEYSGVGVKVSNITYKSLNWREVKTGQWVWRQDVSNVSLLGLDIYNTKYSGIVWNKSNKYNLVSDCDIHPGGTCGVDIANGGDYNIVEKSKIHDCHYAFHTSSSDNIENVFRENWCYNLTGDIVSITASSLGTKILYNILHDAEDDGIHCFDDGKAEVIGNLIYNCKGVPLWVNGNGGIVTRNNTVIGLAPKNWKNEVIWIEKNNHIFKNNIVYVEHPDMKLLTISGSGDIDYNCWYNPNYAGSSVGLNDIVADPRFADIANNDYRLQADSPCKGMGYPHEIQPEPEPEPPTPEPQLEYVEKSVLIEALQGMIDKIKGV